MENLIKTSGSAAGQAVVAAVPMIVGAALAEPYPSGDYRLWFVLLTP